MNDYRNFQRRNSKRRRGKGKHGQNRFGSGKHHVQQKNTYSNIYSTKYKHIQSSVKRKNVLPTASTAQRRSTTNLHMSDAPSCLTADSYTSVLHTIRKLTSSAQHKSNCHNTTRRVQRFFKKINTDTLKWANAHPTTIEDGDFITVTERVQQNESSKDTNVLRLYFGNNVDRLVIGIVSPIDGRYFKLRRRSTGTKIFKKIKDRMINDKSQQFEEYFERKHFFNQIPSHVLIHNIIKPYLYPYDIFKLLSLSRSMYYFIMTESVCKCLINQLKSNGYLIDPTIVIYYWQLIVDSLMDEKNRNKMKEYIKEKELKEKQEKVLKKIKEKEKEKHEREQKKKQTRETEKRERKKDRKNRWIVSGSDNPTNESGINHGIGWITGLMPKIDIDYIYNFLDNFRNVSYASLCTDCQFYKKFKRLFDCGFIGNKIYACIFGRYESIRTRILINYRLRQLIHRSRARATTINFDFDDLCDRLRDFGLSVRSRSDKNCQHICDAIVSFCVCMINYIQFESAINIKFYDYQIGTSITERLHICEEDINKWNEMWENLFGYNVLSMIRNMFMYSVLFCQDIRDQFGCIDLTDCTRYKYVYLYILDSRIINLLSYYCDLCNYDRIINISHHFDKIKLSRGITLHFIIDYQNELNWNNFKHSNQLDTIPVPPNTMSVPEMVNQAAKNKDLLYWKYNTFYEDVPNDDYKSKIRQCMSTFTVTNFRYTNDCSMYNQCNLKNGTRKGSKINLTKNLKFLNFCKVFQHFQKIDIHSRYEDEVGIKWVQNKCKANAGCVGYMTQWIVMKKENDDMGDVDSYHYNGLETEQSRRVLIRENFAAQLQTVPYLKLLINKSDGLLKSKLQQSFVYKINRYNYNLFYFSTRNKRKKYSTYLKNIDKDTRNINTNWIELQHFRNKSRVIKIATPNENKVLNIGVFYKQKQIARYREIALKLKQKKYGVYTTKHYGFDKLSKYLFLRLICINYLFPFEIFLLSRINRGFYQLLHSDYTIIKKYLMNREYKTQYYLKKIQQLIKTFQNDSLLSQNIISRVNNRFKLEEPLSVDIVFEFWDYVLEFLKCFGNINNCSNNCNTKIECVTNYYCDYDILRTICQHDHVEECINGDDCNCNPLTAHPRLNILNIIGKMCIFWILTSQSKQYQSLNCRRKDVNFQMFSKIMPADRLITSLTMNYKCHDHDDQWISKTNITSNDMGLLFSHNINTINFGNVKFILTQCQSQLYKMHSRNPKSFLIEYRVSDSQFIQYFNKFKYNEKQCNCFAKFNAMKNDNKTKRDLIGNLIFLHINKVFENYWNYLLFDHLSYSDETYIHVDDIMTWLYKIDEYTVGTTKSNWKDETIKVILFAVTNMYS